MADIDFLKEYAQLKEKYTHLPEYEIFNHYVEVSFLTYEIYDNKLMARFFRRLLERRLESMIGFFQNILYPNNQSLISMEESGFFNDDEKVQLSNVMKQCMILYRTCSLLNYSYSESEECNKIAEIMEFLLERKDLIDEKINTIKNQWSKQAVTNTAFYTG